MRRKRSGSVWKRSSTSGLVDGPPNQALHLTAAAKPAAAGELGRSAAEAHRGLKEVRSWGFVKPSANSARLLVSLLQAAGELTVATGRAVGSGAAATARGTVKAAKATGRAMTGRRARQTAEVAGQATVAAVTTVVVTAVAGPIAGPIAGALAGAATGQAVRGSGSDGSGSSDGGQPPAQA